MNFELTDSFKVAAGSDRVWEFFSTAMNLPKITPAWMDFRIVTPEPMVIQKDAFLDYTIRWMGIPVKWRTRILEFDPPRRFVDLQTRGPYALWWHEHWFEPRDVGTMCWDRVVYRLPFGPVGRLTHAVMVRRQLLDIFKHRRQVIAREMNGMEAADGDLRITSLRASEAPRGIPV